MLPPVPVVVLGVSAATTAAVGAHAVRNRDVPGAVPFALLMASLTLWTGAYAVALVTTTPSWRLFLEDVQWLGTTLHLWLFLFALEYTGFDRFVTRRSVAVLLVVPTASLLAFWTNPLHGFMYTDATVVLEGGLALVEYDYAVGFWLHTAWTYALILVAFGLLVRLIFISEYLYADQSALLGAGIAIPLVVNGADIVFFEGIVLFDVTPVAFAVTGVCFGYAIYRRRLFDLIPATRTLGRNEAIRQLDTGVVIVDPDHRIVYANRAAADVFDSEPADLLGRRAGDVVDRDWLDFAAEDALAEVERDDRVFEVRTSPVTDRADRSIGHTLVLHDVTARKRREAELSTVNDLNAVIRGVNGALVSATTREEIERAVCDRLADAALYDRVRVGDVQTWRGEADRWRTAGEGEAARGPASESASGDGASDSEETDRPALDVADIRDAPTTTDGDALPVAAGDDWLVVPVVYGRTVYGAIGLATAREDVSDRERAVLGELGELVGHAIDAVESRALFDADTVLELSLAVEGGEDPIAAATADGARLDVLGVVPRAGEGHLAYLEVTDGDPGAVRERLAAADVSVRMPADTDDVLEVTVEPSLSLAPIVAGEAHLLGGTVADGTATYDLLTSEDAARTLLDRLEAAFPATSLLSKRERAHPLSAEETIPEERLAELTDRQQETLEAAVRAGYFEWPREADAETVAEELDISSSTLHGHLRKAEGTLLAALFETDEES